MRKKYDVFISYDDENQKIVEALSHYLEERHVKCFVTYRDIPRNVDQDSFTMEAIGQSQMMLVVFSGVVKMNESMLHNLEVCTEMGKPVLSYRLMNSALYNQNKDYYMTLNWRVGFPNLDECFDAVFRNIVSLVGVEQVDFEGGMMNGDTCDSNSDFCQDLKVETEEEPEPDLHQNPEEESEGEPEVDLQPEPEMETEGEPEPDLQQKPEMETEGEPEPDLQPEPEVETEEEPETDLQPEPEEEPEGEPEPDFQPEPEEEPEGEPEPDLQQEAEEETEGEPEPDLQQEPEEETEGEPEPDLQQEAEEETEGEPEPDLQQEAEEETEGEPEPDLQQNPEMETEGEPEPDLQQEAEEEPEGEPEPDFQQEPEEEPDGEPEPDFQPEPEEETEEELEPDFQPELEEEPDGEPEPDLQQELEEETEGEPEPDHQQELEEETEGEPEPDLQQELEEETEGEPEPDFRQELDDESEGMLKPIFQLINSEDIASLFEMVPVKGGTFLMGAQRVSPHEQNFDKMAFGDEEPVHAVELSDFQISKTVVTQAQWKAVMGDLNVQVRFVGDDLPVDSVSWEIACDFISELNAKTGLNFSFPTEAEWEFAARGGVLGNYYKYSGGDNLNAVGWNVKNSSGTTHPVAQKTPNELGLFDMSGNVWEWCVDDYCEYSKNSQTNPLIKSDGVYHVLRGGSAKNNDIVCRVSSRNAGSSGMVGLIGIRLVLR